MVRMDEPSSMSESEHDSYSDSAIDSSPKGRENCPQHRKVLYLDCCSSKEIFFLVWYLRTGDDLLSTNTLYEPHSASAASVFERIAIFPDIGLCASMDFLGAENSSLTLMMPMKMFEFIREQSMLTLRFFEKMLESKCEHEIM